MQISIYVIKFIIMDVNELINSSNGTDKEYIKWEKRFEIGVPLIDEQHKSLVKLCNDLHKQLMQNKALAQTDWREAFINAIKQGSEYVQTHFRDEENLMKAAGFADYANHKKVHDTFTQKILTSVSTFNDASIVTAFQFVKFLYEWILSHIAHDDKLFARAVLEYYKKTGQQ